MRTQHAPVTKQVPKIASLAFAILAASLPLMAAPGWPAPTAEARVGSYWWWPASAVSREGITRELETYRNAGWGNMGVIAIYGVKGREELTIPAFSPEWFAMFNHAVAEGRRLGLNIDVTPSSGWRMGGPHITREQAEMRFRAREGRISTEQLRTDVKRACLSARGLAVNPYSLAATKFHFDWMAARFRDGNGLAPRAFYYDSFENEGNWAPELPERFRQWRGYDIHSQGGALGGRGDAEHVRRVMHDYRETLSEMLIECVDYIAAWSRERGSKLRMQAHGAPANLLDMYAAASIPETEVFGASRFDIPGFRREDRWCAKDTQSDLVIRFASSAAHVAGHPLVLSESFTWLREHFHTALSHIKPEMDRLLLGGINHIYYHGSCYSARDAEWPGWLFYASTQANWRNTIFRDIPALNGYLTRCQSVLQAARPHNDILLYWPLHDLWMGGGDRELRFTVHNPTWIEKTTCGEAARQLLKQGHTFDFISDKQIRHLTTKDGSEATSIVTEGGNSYRTVLIPAARFMHLETARHLLELAKAGATIILWRNAPGDVPGFHDYAARREELAGLFGQLAFDDGAAPIGKGRFLLGDDLAGLLERATITREPMTDLGLRFIRRNHDGEIIYFIANQSAGAVDGWVPLAANGNSAILMDAMTGRIGVPAFRNDGPQAEVHLQVLPGESRILRVLPRAAGGVGPWPVHRMDGDPTAIAGPWRIEFIDGGPALPKPGTLESSACWTTLEAPEVQRFGGTARYSTTITRPGDADARQWHLDLGDVRESARVTLNGKPVGTLVAHPFRIDLGDALHPGENLLEIEVTNLAANRIRDLDLQRVPWKKFHDINFVNIQYKPFDASKWPITPSGLTGPVKLIPVNVSAQP